MKERSIGGVGMCYLNRKERVVWVSMPYEILMLLCWLSKVGDCYRFMGLCCMGALKLGISLGVLSWKPLMYLIALMFGKV